MPSGNCQRLAQITFVVLPNLKFAGTSGKPDTPIAATKEALGDSISGAMNRIAILAREGLRGTLERHIFVGAEKIERLKHQALSSQS